MQARGSLAGKAFSTGVRRGVVVDRRVTRRRVLGWMDRIRSGSPLSRRSTMGNDVKAVQPGRIPMSVNCICHGIKGSIYGNFTLKLFSSSVFCVASFKSPPSPLAVCQYSVSLNHSFIASDQLPPSTHLRTHELQALFCYNHAQDSIPRRRDHWLERVEEASAIQNPPPERAL